MNKKLSERILDTFASLDREGFDWEDCKPLADEVAALETKLEAMEQELEEQRGQKERLQWAVQIVLKDFQDNDGPCLSQAGVNAIWVVEPLAAAQQETE